MKTVAKQRKFKAFLARLAVVVIFAGVLCVGVNVFAFATSEDQQFAADVAEAKARASDFDRTLNRIEEIEKERESSGYLMHEARERAAEEAEQIRSQFVRERNNRPSDEEERERLEIEDNKVKEREAQIAEENRRMYIIKRDRVREIIEREATIDEKREYGL